MNIEFRVLTKDEMLKFQHDVDWRLISSTQVQSEDQLEHDQPRLSEHEHERGILDNKR